MLRITASGATGLVDKTYGLRLLSEKANDCTNVTDRFNPTGALFGEEILSGLEVMGGAIMFDQTVTDGIQTLYGDGSLGGRTLLIYEYSTSMPIGCGTIVYMKSSLDD